MDSDPPVGERDLHPTLNGDPSLFFDVVKELGDNSEAPAQKLSFCYASSSLIGVVEPDIDDEEYAFTITLRVSGGGYSQERDFRISKKWNDPLNRYDKLMMEPS
jgi:hypothetical protein